MKLVIVAALALVACAVAAPAAPFAPVASAAPAAPVGVSAVNVKEPVKILKSDFDQEPNGQYKYGFETEDGTAKDETGEVRSLTNEKNEPVDVIVVRGSYSYTDPEGKLHTYTYVADENGYQVEESKA